MYYDKTVKRLVGEGYDLAKAEWLVREYLTDYRETRAKVALALEEKFQSRPSA